MMPSHRSHPGRLHTWEEEGVCDCGVVSRMHPLFQALRITDDQGDRPPFSLPVQEPPVVSSCDPTYKGRHRA